MKQGQLAGKSFPPLRCKCLVVWGCKESGGKAYNARWKVFQDVCSLFSLRLERQNEPSSGKNYSSVQMYKSHMHPQIIHVSLSVTISSLTAYQYTTMDCAFLDVIMADLDYKLLNQWVIGVWGHILSWEFHKINPVLAKGTCIQSWRSWWFHEVYGPSGTRWRTLCREPLSQRKDTMQMCSCWTSGAWE